MNYFFRKVWPIFFIIVIWSIFSSQYFLQGLVPFPSKYLVTFFPPWSASYAMPVKNNAMPDVITQIYPWKKITIDTWKSGNIPLWNPNAFAGTPHAGNYQTAVFSPFNILFFILPFVDAWSMLILLQPLLAGLCMYVYLSELDLRRLSRTAGSIAFMFCGFFVVWMAYGTLGYAALFLPLALFAVERYVNKRSWWAPLLLSISITLSLFSGHFQISLYVLFATFAYIVYKKSVTLMIFFLGGIGMALPQILPTLAAYQNAVRSNLFAKGEVIPWQYLITIFAPDFYGNPVTRNDWFGHYAEWSSYAGVVTLLLAGWGILKKKEKRKWFWIVLVVLSLLFAFPTPLNDILYIARIPVLSTSSASRIIILASFGLSVLAAFGLEDLSFDHNRRKVFKFSLIAIVVLCIFWSVLLFGKIFPPDKLMIARRNSVLPTIFAVSGLALFWLHAFVKKKYGGIVLFFIVCLIALEVLRFSMKWMPFDPIAYVYPKLSVINYLQKTTAPFRVLGFYGGELGNYFSVESLEGYDAVYQGRYGRFIKYVNSGELSNGERSVALVSNKGKYLEETMQLLGIRYVLHRVSDNRFVWAYPFWNYPYYKQTYKDDQYEVYENERVYPRTFLASAYTVNTTEEDILKKLFAKDMDRRTTVVLEREPAIKPESGEGSAKIERYSPETVRISVNSKVPKILFLSDVFDDGWNATIDGTITPVLRADYDFRAVAVPAGTHTVIFRYQPKSVSLGIRLALFSLAGLIAGTVILKTTRNV